MALHCGEYQCLKESPTISPKTEEQSPARVCWLCVCECLQGSSITLPLNNDGKFKWPLNKVYLLRSFGKLPRYTLQGLSENKVAQRASSNCFIYKFTQQICKPRGRQVYSFVTALCQSLTLHWGCGTSPVLAAKLPPPTGTFILPPSISSLPLLLLLKFLPVWGSKF